MFRKLIWIPLVFFSSVNLFSQSKNNKSTISVSEGISIPVFQFASHDIHKSNAGFAGTGELSKITYTNYLWKKFGITGMIARQSNSINTAVLAENYSHINFFKGVYSGSGGISQVPVVTGRHNFYNSSLFNSNLSDTVFSKWGFKKSSWQSFSLLAGVTAEFASKNSKVSYDVKALTGISFVISPLPEGKGTTDTSLIQLAQKRSSAMGIAYLLGAGIKYRIDKHLYLLADIELSGTNRINFKKVTTYDTGQTTSSSGLINQWESKVERTIKQSVSSLNISAGIGFRF